MVVPVFLSGAIDLMRPYASLVLPVFFVGFFLATLAALVCSENRYVRRVYVGGFFTLLLVTNLFMPVTPAPLVKWHKFSEIRPTEQTKYEIRVVDEAGNEIKYDNKATWKASGMAMRVVQNELLEETAPDEKRETSQYLLRKAREHRAHLGDRSPSNALRFPPHATVNTWTAAELEAYDRFVGIRLYRMELETSRDGTEVTGYTEAVVYEYAPDSESHSADETRANDAIADSSAAYSADVRPPAAGGVPA